MKKWLSILFGNKKGTAPSTAPSLTPITRQQAEWLLLHVGGDDTDDFKMGLEYNRCYRMALNESFEKVFIPTQFSALTANQHAMMEERRVYDAIVYLNAISWQLESYMQDRWR